MRRSGDEAVAGTLEIVVALLVFVIVLTAYFTVVGQSFVPVEQDVPPRSQSVLLSTLLMSEPGRLDDGGSEGNTSWEDFPASGRYAVTSEPNIEQNLTGLGLSLVGAGYGVIDRDKAEAMRKVPYDDARGHLGLDDLQLHFNMRVTTTEGEVVVDYGPSPRPGSDVHSFKRVVSLDQVNTSIVPVDFAVPEKLVINEVMYHPVNEVSGSDQEEQYEWVELYNPNNDAVNVSGWHILNDNPNNANNNEPSSDNELKAWDTGGTRTIPPDGYAIVVGSTSVVYDYFIIDEDAVKLKMDFDGVSQNGLKPHGEGGVGQGDLKGERIELVNDQGATVEFLEYETSWGGHNPNADENFTMARIDPYGDANDPSNWEDSESSLGNGPGGGGTAGQTNEGRSFRFNRTKAFLRVQLFRSPQIHETVVINEIMYDPSTGNDDHEYVELYNPTDTAIDLDNWTLADGAETETLSGLTDRGDAQAGILPGKGYAVVTGQDNDDEVASQYDVHEDAVWLEVDDGSIGDGLGSGDDVTVERDDGIEVESFTYEDDADASGTGESLERIEPLEDWTSSNVDVSDPDDGLDGTPGRVNSRTAS